MYIHITLLLLKFDCKYSFTVDRYFVFNDEQERIENQV